MQTPEQILARRGVPIDSCGRAGIYINHTDHPESMYREALDEILGITLPPFVDNRTAKLTYAYFAQEYLRAYLNGLPCFNVEEIFMTAQSKAGHLIATQPYHWIIEDDEKVAAPAYTDDGLIKHKKGWKREQAFELYRKNPEATKKEIMDIFMKELGMSSSGAQTYYYNAKNEIDS